MSFHIIELDGAFPQDKPLVQLAIQTAAVQGGWSHFTGHTRAYLLHVTTGDRWTDDLVTQALNNVPALKSAGIKAFAARPF